MHIYIFIHIYIYIYCLQALKYFTPNQNPIGTKNLVEHCQVLLFGAFRPKLCGNCAFPQNFHTRKLGEITRFFAVVIIVIKSLIDLKIA